MKNFSHPLMENNITSSDVNSLISFLKNNKKRIFTQSKKVIEFEKKWSKWLGTKYSIFVNSGSSANLLTLQALKILFGIDPVMERTTQAMSEEEGTPEEVETIPYSEIPPYVKELEGHIKNVQANINDAIEEYNETVKRITEMDADEFKESGYNQGGVPHPSVGM